MNNGEPGASNPAESETTMLTGTFTLSIQCGNDAMQTPEQIADALQDVIGRIRRHQGLGASVYDANGNKVGETTYEDAATPSRARSRK